MRASHLSIREHSHGNSAQFRIKRWSRNCLSRSAWQFAKHRKRGFSNASFDCRRDRGVESQCVGLRQRQRPGSGFAVAGASAGSDTNADTNTDADADADPNANSDTNSHADSNANTDPNPDSNPDAYSYTNPDSHSGTYLRAAAVRVGRLVAGRRKCG